MQQLGANEGGVLRNGSQRGGFIFPPGKLQDPVWVQAVEAVWLGVLQGALHVLPAGPRVPAKLSKVVRKVLLTLRGPGLSWTSSIPVYLPYWALFLQLSLMWDFTCMFSS